MSNNEWTIFAQAGMLILFTMGSTFAIGYAILFGFNRRYVKRLNRTMRDADRMDTEL